MPALEYLLMALAAGGGVFFVIVPGVKLYRKLFPPKIDPLEEARVRLELARKDREAARLNAEAEKLYDDMLNEVLDEDETEKKGRR